MPIDVSVPQSDGWWLHQLARKLEERNKRLTRLSLYMDGNPPLPAGANNWRAAYRAFQKKSRLNLAELIVEAPRERMTPAGFQAAGSDDTDVEAQKIWVDNDLDVESAEVHGTMLSLGDSYVIVGPPDDTGSPVVTAEDPRQVVTAHDPVRQRRVRAAAKLFHDRDAGEDLAYLYMPGVDGGPARVRVASRKIRRLGLHPAVRFNPGSWDWDEERSGDLDVNRVPVVRFRNRRGISEFEPHTDVLDRINHMILQRMVIATFQAFKQRALKNAPLTDPDTGEEIDYEAIFSSDPGAIWQLPGGADMWESGQVDLTPILTSVRDDLQHLAAVSRTPLTYITPDAASQSAEGASLMREGLVFKTENRILRAAAGWLDVLSLAFEFLGDDRARRGELTMLWRPVERYSLAERADAASKAADIPWKSRMTSIWQYTPTQVERMETERASDMLMGDPPADPDVG